ncbi:hypothetical protein F4604DRAFT_1687607 [Suillus subluteus]|nr:hypothetical protein F4604DRAFT_1687607 [Suillus subluteus]
MSSITGLFDRLHRKEQEAGKRTYASLMLASWIMSVVCTPKNRLIQPTSASTTASNGGVASQQTLNVMRGTSACKERTYTREEGPGSVGHVLAGKTVSAGREVALERAEGEKNNLATDQCLQEKYWASLRKAIQMYDDGGEARARQDKRLHNHQYPTVVQIRGVNLLEKNHLSVQKGGSAVTIKDFAYHKWAREEVDMEVAQIYTSVLPEFSESEKVRAEQVKHFTGLGD